MQAVFRLESSELDLDFLESIKKIFAKRRVEISIVDADEEDRLLSSMIEEGLTSKSVSQEELFRVLNAD